MEGNVISNLQETIGYKLGIALSVDTISEFLIDSDYLQYIQHPNHHNSHMYPLVKNGIYSDIYDILSSRLTGHENPFRKKQLNQIFVDIEQKYPNQFLYLAELVRPLYTSILNQIIDFNKISKDIMEQATIKYGLLGEKLAHQLVENIQTYMHYNPFQYYRYYEWTKILNLDALFHDFHSVVENGRFMDQRYIDYLVANTNQLQNIHWRKFEELSAEYLDRQGFIVELGPGRNDDGIDIKAWKKDNSNYLCLIQCKRYKNHVEKIHVKALYSDILENNSTEGLIITTSQLAQELKKQYLKDSIQYMK